MIDTGADLDHDDLEDNILPRGAEDWDFADGADPGPEDEDGHGSHVSGTVAAVGNTIGVIGVAPGLPGDAAARRPHHRDEPEPRRRDQLRRARSANANPDRRYVINCSWRMNGDHAGVRTAIQNAVGTTSSWCSPPATTASTPTSRPQFPGVYPEVIAVAALDSATTCGRRSRTSAPTSTSPRPESTSGPRCPGGPTDSWTARPWRRRTWPGWPPWSGRATAT